MTQRDRVLRALRMNPSFGITPLDFMQQDTIDGGAHIFRLAARIEELRARGHDIRNIGGRHARYVLVGDSEMGGRTQPENGRRVVAGHSPAPSDLGAAPSEVHPSASPGTGSSPSEALSHPSVEPVPLFDDEPAPRRVPSMYDTREAA